VAVTKGAEEVTVFFDDHRGCRVTPVRITLLGKANGYTLIGL
jgi:hypothetical protein